MGKESIEPDSAPEEREKPIGSEPPEGATHGDNPQDVFSSPDKKILPPVSREEALRQAGIEPDEQTGTKGKSNISPWDRQKGRKG